MKGSEALFARQRTSPPDEPDIRRALLAAESLHGNFYEIHLDYRGTQLALEDAEYLLAVLWGLLPEEYTGGATFDDWVASDDN